MMLTSALATNVDFTYTNPDGYISSTGFNADELTGIIINQTNTTFNITAMNITLPPQTGVVNFVAIYQLTTTNGETFCSNYLANSNFVASASVTGSPKVANFTGLNMGLGLYGIEFNTTSGQYSAGVDTGYTYPTFDNGIAYIDGTNTHNCGSDVGFYNVKSISYQVTSATANGTESGNITGVNVTYPNHVNVGTQVTTFANATDVVFRLYRNNFLISSATNSSPANDTALLGVGTYNYILNTTGGANYSSNSSLDTRVITVSQGAIPNIIYTLNGSARNITVDNGSAVIVSATVNLGGGVDNDANFSIWDNNTLLNSSLASQTTLTNLSFYVNTTTILHNIVANITAGTNFTRLDNRTLWINVTNAPPFQPPPQPNGSSFVICKDNQTLLTTDIFIINGVTQNLTVPTTCQFGCDQLNNQCNPDPTNQTIWDILIFVGIIIFLVVITKLLRLW
jgi:hypothetical protein